MIYDALIVGGGPAGATTALLLANAGWSVAIVEKKIFPRRKVCGEFMSATNLPLLHKLGISDFYYALGGPEIKRVGLFSSDTILTSPMPFANQSLKSWGRALGREHLDKKLLDMATIAGAEVWQPWQLKLLQRDAEIFIGTLENNQNRKHIAAHVVIMANGSWERGIHSCEYPTQSSDLLAFKAHFKNSTLDADLMPLITFPGGYGGLVQSDSGRVTLSCCIRRDRLAKIRRHTPGLQAGEVVLHHIRSHCKGVNNALFNAEREGNWLAVGPIRPGIRKCYEEGIFYVGNIAGEAHPVVAEGISMAMQSGWLLSETLLKHQQDILSNHTISNAGLEYTQQWHKYFSSRIHIAAILAQLTMRPWIMSLTMPLLKKFPSLLTLGAKSSGKIKQVVPIITS